MEKKDIGHCKKFIMGEKFTKGKKLCKNKSIQPFNPSPFKHRALSKMAEPFTKWPP